MNGDNKQTDGERERKIREKAYRLWEEAGRPEGRALEHWAEANRKFDEERRTPGGGQHARVPKESELKAARSDNKKATKAAKRGGRNRKPVSPGG
ncbi:MAG: DUF2934 domain-containing protein [Parvibaculaceae bacterium]